MDSQEQQLVDRIKQANTILVTVSANPTVDQLAACLGVSIMLNGLGKHTAAVFSGMIPSTIEFLQPEKTIEKNTDGLRDFIIALDKSKADKLRYKVEDKVVKIFITPYRTSISEKDFEFSQGDFNVELVLALGVHEQSDLDQAITAHGRILHDATVASINTTSGNNLGTISWQDTKASSLSEMVAHLAEKFDKKVLDNQVATALLTGIISETDRFSNSRTTPETMKTSAQLMALGANPQLVATKLQTTPPMPPPPLPPRPPLPPPPASPTPPTPAVQPLKVKPVPSKQDGTLRIEHAAEEGAKQQSVVKVNPGASDDESTAASTSKKVFESGNDVAVPVPTKPEIHIDEQGNLRQMGESRTFLSGPGPEEEAPAPGVEPVTDDDEEQPSGVPNKNSEFIFTPPSFGSAMTANSGLSEGAGPSADTLDVGQSTARLLAHSNEPAAMTATNNPPSGSDDNKASGSAVDSTASDSTPAAIPDLKLPEPATMTGSVAGAPSGTPPLSPSKTTAASDGHMTLDDIEESVGSAHTQNADLNSARDAVTSAIDEDVQADFRKPIAALNANPLVDGLHSEGDEQKSEPTGAPSLNDKPVAVPLANPSFNEPAPAAASPSAQPMDMPLPPTLTPPPASTTPPTSSDNDNPTAPPPVPPPMMPLISPK